jgi:hypothetical protein
MTDLTEEEFLVLLRVEKFYEGDSIYDYPALSGAVSIPLRSRSPREDFQLDISRARIRISKNKFQNRVRSIVILARLDLNGPPHRNPDGTETPASHLHLYRPGYGDKWAVLLPPCFTNTNDIMLTLDQFMDYCNVVMKPSIQGRLF